VKGDYTYGPFLMNRTLLPVIAAIRDELGWGFRPAVFMAAAGLGLRVNHLIGDYPCPEEQRLETEKDQRHRRRQFDENITGLSGRAFHD
jgi:hypothetical protein